MMEASFQDNNVLNMIDRLQLFMPECWPSRGVQCPGKQNHGFYSRSLLRKMIVPLWKDDVTYTGALCSRLFLNTAPCS